MAIRLRSQPQFPPVVTGTITFTSGGVTLGSGTIVNGTVSITTTALTPPSDVITATYSGDGNYNPATGTTTQTVGKANLTTTLTSSVNPSLPGSSVTFTDTLPSNATGTVTFTSGSTTLGTSYRNRRSRDRQYLNASSWQRPN